MKSRRALLVRRPEEARVLEKSDTRRLTGLTALMLGLTGVFASLTLVAVSKPRLAAVFAIPGVMLAVTGLRLLPSDTR